MKIIKIYRDINAKKIIFKSNSGEKHLITDQGLLALSSELTKRNPMSIKSSQIETVDATKDDYKNIMGLFQFPDEILGLFKTYSNGDLKSLYVASVNK